MMTSAAMNEEAYGTIASRADFALVIHKAGWHIYVLPVRGTARPKDRNATNHEIIEGSCLKNLLKKTRFSCKLLILWFVFGWGLWPRCVSVVN